MILWTQGVACSPCGPIVSFVTNSSVEQDGVGSRTKFGFDAIWLGAGSYSFLSLLSMSSYTPNLRTSLEIFAVLVIVMHKYS
jgi:hypothetical protein